MPAPQNFRLLRGLMLLVAVAGFSPAADLKVTGAFDVSIDPICTPTQTGSQVVFPSEFEPLPKSIPEGRNGFFLQVFVGTGTEFLDTPATSSASIYVCIDDILPQNLKVIISPLGDPSNSASVVLWDHEFFLSQADQPVTHIEALANLPFAGQFPSPGSTPPTYSYLVRVIDDQPGEFGGASVGTFNSSVLTLNPNNPGHIGPPIVNLYADEALRALPTTIEFGDDFSVFATAIGNPASYSIDRLGLRIVERVDVNPLNPDLVNPLPTYQQHNSGIGAGVYIQHDVAQAPGSTNGVGLSFGSPNLPALPPGFYELTANAWDSAGFNKTVIRNFTVMRSFGFLSVANVVPEVNTSCDESLSGIPCNTTNFAATLNLINNTPNDSGSLRIRLVNVPGGAFQDIAKDDFDAALALQPERDFGPTEVSVSTVTPLPACTAEQVQICGVIPAPIQTLPPRSFGAFGIGFQVYAVLEECDSEPAQCADPNLPDLWIPLDTIRITEGEWPVIGDFGGPGGGTNQDRRGGRGRNAPYMLDSVAIVGPATVPASSTAQYHANATLKKANGATKSLSNVNAQWTIVQPTDPTLVSIFTINSSGLFQAGAVTVDTPVTIRASYTFGGVTKTQDAQIIVSAPTTARTAARITAHRPADEMSDDDMSSMATADSGPTPKKKNKPPKPQKISLSVSSTNINEGGSAVITVSAKKPSTIPVTVSYALSGSARLNTHYVICGDPGMITIPAGATSASVRLTAIANDLNLGAEAATVTLVPGTGYKLPRHAPAASINITNVAAPLCP